MNGIINGSRTLDTLAIFTVFSAMQPLLMDVLTAFNLSPKWISLTNLIFIAFLAYLRYKTTGPVGTPK
jgi:hypothetical protein